MMFVLNVYTVETAWLLQKHYQGNSIREQTDLHNKFAYLHNTNDKVTFQARLYTGTSYGLLLFLPD